jgi:uncharacterized protein
MTTPHPLAASSQPMNPPPSTPYFSGVLFLAAVLCFTARSATPPTPANPEHTERLVIMIPMRDGVRLATDVWLPTPNEAHPVVLLRFPYNKNLASGLGRDGTARGYAIVAQDTRGRFASEGENLPFHLDMADGPDTLEWILAQPWCNGRVGTWGGSAGAITQFQLAIGDTGRLHAQHLTVGAPNLYNVVYTGGVFRKALVEDWLRATQFATHALAIWESHPTYDAYWQARDASPHYHRIHAPAVHIGGYWDIFAQPTLDGFVGYQNRGGRGARRQQKLVFGPWAHAVLQDKVGELNFPGGHQPPGNPQDPWAWFDRWLKDEPNRIDNLPAVTYYVLGDVTDATAPGNQWRTADRWPPVKTHPTRYYFQPNRSLATQRPTSTTSFTYPYDPRKPVPTLGGIQLTIPAGPMDQSSIENRPDVLVFSTEPLATPTEVTGRVRARLWISSDAPDTDFFVRLCDVYPDGRSFNLTEGMLRTRFRRGFDRELPLEPGRIYPIDIDVWSTSIVFNRGHRIRVHVTSSSSPGFDPNPNTGARFRSGPEQRIAHNTLHLSRRYPSHITLPVARSANRL